MSDALAEWITTVHSSLAPVAVERTSAAWGPVTMRHRTSQPDWYAAMDLAWAQPIERGVDVDVITASFADLPADISPPVIRKGDLGPRQEVPIAAGSAIRMTWREEAGEAVAWDPESGRALVLRASPPNGYDMVSPMRSLVHWALVRAGGMLVHAAVVARTRGSQTSGLLLLGEAGYGKSTTTLACVSQGWVTCGDDAVAVFGEHGAWRAHAIYAAIKTKLTSASPADLTATETITWDIAGTKRVHLLTSTSATTLVPAVDLVGLVLLDPHASTDNPITEVDAATSRTLSAPSTVMPLPFDRPELLRHFGLMAQELPAVRLPRRQSMARTVTDVAEIADRLEPRVSVVMPLFNGQEFIADAVDSVLAQTVGCFQIIAVNDASPDDSLAVVQGLRGRIEAAGHRLDIVDLAVNRGIGGARNAGLEQAEFPLVAWLDQDDLWPAQRTAVLAAALRTGAQVAAGRMRFVDIRPEVARGWARTEWFDRADHPGHALGALLCQRSVLDEVGYLDDSLRSGADDIEWLTRLQDSGIARVDVNDVTLVRRVHESNQSALTEPKEMLAAVRAHLNRLRQV